MKSEYIWIGGITAVIIMGIIFMNKGGVSDEVVPVSVTATTSSTGVASTTTESASTTKTITNKTKTKMITTASGLIIEDEVIGTGAEAKVGDNVTVQYVGQLTNGKVFDASLNHGTQGFSFPLGAGHVIKGWDEGVAGMKVGGKRKLTIPSNLAYGSQDVGNGLIPANSTLIFEVELLSTGR